MDNLIDLYHKLYILSEKQGQVIAEENYNKLIKLLHEKQQVIKVIEKINVRDYLQKQDNPHKKLTKLKEKVINLNILEEKNRELLKSRLKQLTDKLRNFNLKQRSRNTYRISTNSNFEAKFINRKL